MNEEWKKQVDIDMSDLKVRMGIAESSIRDVKEDIKSIRDDTKWLRRTFTGALITGTIAGVLGLFFFLIKTTMGGN